MKTRTWHLLSPPILLSVGLILGGIQVLLLPRYATSITDPQVIGEVVFALLVGGGMFYIPSAQELTMLEVEDVGRIYPPIFAGLGLIFIRAVTDLLDEFLVYPELLLTVLEDGTMILGTGLLVLAVARWSESRMIREQLLEAQRDTLNQQAERLESFANIVSHDLRNPLNVAMGQLDLAREEADSDALRIVSDALVRMNQIIDDTLNLAQIGPNAVEFTSISLRQTVEDAWGSVSIADADLSITMAGDVIIQADKSYVQQLFENVFRNAVEHGGGAVTITVGELNNGFYIEDDGPGIPEVERDEIFDAGYSTAEQGTGLGLLIVKQVANAHGWEIRVTEGTEGGARFEITDVEFTV